jgi:hypothetical protein
MPDFQVRYGTFGQSVEARRWVDCLGAKILDGGALAIELDDDNMEYIPLHYIRGPIQVRRKTSAPTD